MLVIGDTIQLLNYPIEKHIGKQGKVVFIHNGFGENTQPLADGDNLPKLQTELRYNVELDEGIEVNDLKEQQLRKFTSDDDMKLTGFIENWAAHLSGAKLSHDNSETIYEVARRLVRFVLGEDSLKLSEDEQTQVVSESIEMISTNYGDKLKRTFTRKEASRITIVDEIERLKIKYPLK